MNWIKFKIKATVVIAVACIVCIALLLGIAFYLAIQMLSNVKG